MSCQKDLTGKPLHYPGVADLEELYGVTSMISPKCQCGQWLQDYWKYCPKCGKKIKEE